MSKSATFTKAHKIAKANKYGIGTYAKRFSLALKGIYLKSRLAKRKQAIKLADAKANQERLSNWSTNEAAKPKVCPIEAQYLHGLTHSKDLAFNAWS
jgi:hypothetical protein